MPLRILSCVFLSLSIAPAPRAAQPAATREAGITGRVLAPDGAPVTQGNVTLMTSPTNRVNAAIDRGHFRILPDGQGSKRLFISVPGLAPYRASVTVPSSRTMALPDIRLQEASYFHVRFVTSDGEPLAAGLRRRAIDRDGVTIPDPLDHVREQIEPDGSITIGPLPVGRILMAFDRPPFAQTRLRDIDVTGTKKVIEGGTIPIAPGAQLHVEVVDGTEKPVPKHEVWIEDAALPTMLSFQPVRTNEQGRAVFDRLAPGRFRVWTKTVDRCAGRVELTVSRLVAVAGSGATRAKLVVGGRATFKITTVLGALYSRSVTLSPDAPAISPWQSRIVDSMSQPRRLPNMFGSPQSCGGVTDSEGRVTLTPFPPGPAQLRVQLFNSTYVARVTVPENGAEMAIAIPDGLTPVHVTDQITRQPVAAQVIWVGGGGRVEASATPNGDALLEGVGKIGGTLTISAREYQTLEGRFDETPETQQEVALMPSPSARVMVRVVSSDGDAIPAAVVELLPRGAGDAAEFVAADAKGVAMFLEVPEGPLQFGAHAEGFASSTVRVAEDARVSIVISLKRVR